MVKRAGNLKPILLSEDTLREAIRYASRGRKHTKGYIEFNAHRKERMAELRRMLAEGTYKSSQYRHFDRRERGKTRHISALPFYPDRIIHWVLTLTTRDIFMRTFSARSYAAIPGRGTHKALRDLKASLRTGRYTHALKMDVHHYFESIDKAILMKDLTRRIKDPAILSLYREVIFGYPGSGIPIGNLTSQYLANLYLSDLDHFLAEKYHARAFRYMDDIIVLGWSTAWLRRVKTVTEQELAKKGLRLNANWQIINLDEGVDFIGYRSFRTYTLLRKATKRRLIRKMKRINRALDRGAEADTPIRSCIASYRGILSWCDGFRLHQRYISPVMARIEATT